MHMRLSRALVYHPQLLADGHRLLFLPAPRRYARAGILAMALCPCLCLSVTSRCSIKRNERINLLFGMKASFD